MSFRHGLLAGAADVQRAGVRHEHAHGGMAVLGTWAECRCAPVFLEELWLV